MSFMTIVPKALPVTGVDGGDRLDVARPNRRAVDVEVRGTTLAWATISPKSSRMTCVPPRACCQSFSLNRLVGILVVERGVEERPDRGPLGRRQVTRGEPPETALRRVHPASSVVARIACVACDDPRMVEYGNGVSQERARSPAEAAAEAAGPSMWAGRSGTGSRAPRTPSRRCHRRSCSSSPWCSSWALCREASAALVLV